MLFAIFDITSDYRSDRIEELFHMFSRVLKKFITVVDFANITAAAENLNISQPALTKSIQKLEQEVGCKLFERVSNGVHLTKAGEILAHHARVMENEYRHASNRIAELSGKEQNGLRIGAGPVWLVKILPGLVAKFQNNNPDVRVTLVGGVIDTLVPSLISGDLDLICVSLDFPESPELLRVPLFDMSHHVVVDSRHPLASLKEVTPAQISKESWLTLKSDYVATQRISQFFAANGNEPPKISLDTTSIHSLMETLLSGDYIAHIPEQMLEMAQSKGLVKVDLKLPLWKTTSGLALRKNSKTSKALNEFVEIVKTATLKNETA